MYVIYEKEIFMLALLVIFSYLMGSIPTGYIIVKKKFNKDIREFGSGNIGATNVGRIAGKKLSKITAIYDMQVMENFVHSLTAHAVVLSNLCDGY